MHALASANISYAIVGGYAVRVWVAQFDEAAVRATRDVNIPLHPADLPKVIPGYDDSRLPPSTKILDHPGVQYFGNLLLIHHR